MGVFSYGGKGNTIMAGKFFKIQSKGVLQVSNQQFGPSLRVSPYCSMEKAAIVGPVIFERSPSQDAGSDKGDVGRNRGQSDTAATMEGGDVVQELPETVHDRIGTMHEYVTSVTNSKGYAIESSLMPKSGPNLDGNSKVNMGKYQPIIGESCQVNSPANSNREVKRDTHDSSPFNAPINPHSQQSQQQSTNEVHGLNTEIISPEAIKKNKILAATTKETSINCDDEVAVP